MAVVGDKNISLNDEKLIEIRLSDILQFVRQNLRRLVLGGLIGLVTGALYALSKPNEYKAQLTVMPELQSKASGLGNLGSLAGLAGIDVGSLAGNNDVIRPDLYPTVVQTVPFGLYILNQPVVSKKFKKRETLRDFLVHQQEDTWRGKLNLWLASFSSTDDADSDSEGSIKSGQLELTKEQEDLILAIKGRVSVTHDKKSGMLTVETQMPDPIVAANAAQTTLTYLTDYVTSYRTEKARKQVQFLTEQVNRSKRRYQEAEEVLSNYRDRNRGLYLNTAKIEEQRLQADFILAQSLYNDLVKQLEVARIRIQEETPVFKVLEPARIPKKKSGPKRTLITLGFAIAGVLIALSIQGLRLYLSNQQSRVLTK
jgi:uncharacterized protein involved in exopolysaccharide biosynthesis